MFEVFLIILALVWLLFASIQDIKSNEIADWLSLSLICFALGYRFFYSLFNSDFMFFYQGLIGLIIFLVLGNLFYHSKIFAGGDAKLMIALGTILPLSKDFFVNINYFLLFLIFFLFIGSFYTFFASFYLGLKNLKKVKKEIKKQFNLNKNLVVLLSVFGVLVFITGFYSELLYFIGLMIIVLPYLYIYAKSVDEKCMVKKLKTKDLTEGDWLYKEVKVGNKKLHPTWDGLSKKDITLLKKHKKEVLIRQGVAFIPVFLISFIIYIVFYYLDLNLFNIFI